MVEIVGDLWAFHKEGKWVTITTNGTIKSNGACVMGRGVALDAARLYPNLPFLLGEKLKKKGLKVHCFSMVKLIAFPVKHQWHQKADMELIEKSCIQLKEICSIIDSMEGNTQEIYLPRPGCGNGGLQWKAVKPLLEEHLKSNKFKVVELYGKN